MTDPKTTSVATKILSKPKKTKLVPDHPRYTEMVTDAIRTLKERSGSSKTAIVKYIVSKYDLSCNGPSINTNVKRVLKKGVNDGTFSQSKGIGASGSFKICKAKPKHDVKKTAIGNKLKKSPDSKKTKNAKKAIISPKKAKFSNKRKSPKILLRLTKSSKKSLQKAKSPKKTDKKLKTPKMSAKTVKPKTSPKITKPKSTPQKKPKLAPAKKIDNPKKQIPKKSIKK